MVGRPILTAEQMRRAEAEAIAAGTPVETLMERAGCAAAEAIWRFAGPKPTLVLCGPGNNGGDGYVVAQWLAERGVDVRVVALAAPKSPAAVWARSRWAGPVGAFSDASPAPIMVDALFGTGLVRPLDGDVGDRLRTLAAAAEIAVAIDLPSGAATDDGQLLSLVPDFHLTVSFATPKPSHFLQPAARHMGKLVVADIGIEAESDLRLIGRPDLRAPGPDDHKYSRGYVAVLQGEMPGAAGLAAGAALGAGAGYVRIAGDIFLANVPKAVVQGGKAEGILDDERIGALVVGPGLGRGAAAEAILDRILSCRRPLLLDADALVLLEDRLDRLSRMIERPILTPHEGEFHALFGPVAGSKVERAREAARRSGAVVVLKGPDTVVADPDGRAAIAPPASAWLASAGTGDVLAGIIAAMRARGFDAFEAACAGVWLHGRAAAMAGPGLIADDLVECLPRLLAS